MPEVRILWGTAPERGDEPVTYQFATEAEVNAFLKGVDEANGWMDWHQLDPGESYCFECRDTYTGDECPVCDEEG